MAKRRASGEGSIFKRSDGLWVARITVNRQRIQKTSKRQADVRTWLHEKRAQLTEGLQLTAGRTRLSDYLAYWLDIHSSNLCPKTVAMYEQTIRDHITPTLSDIPTERHGSASSG